MASKMSVLYGARRGETAYEERLENERKKAEAEAKKRGGRQDPKAGQQPPAANKDGLPFQDSSPSDKPADKKVPSGTTQTSKGSYAGRIGGPTGVDPNVKVKDEDRDKHFAQQKEFQDSRQKFEREQQENTQNFQREQAAQRNAEWYAQQDYLRGHRDRSVKWEFRSKSSGGHTSSRWNIQTQRGAGGATPGGMNPGQIGTGARGPDGRSSLTMNGPAIAGRQIGGGLVERTPKASTTQGPYKPDASADKFRGFQFEVKGPTTSESVRKANEGLKPEDKDPMLGMKDKYGMSYGSKLDVLARAAAMGVKMEIEHKAVDAAGKPVGETTIDNASAGQNKSEWLAFAQDSSAPVAGRTAADAMAGSGAFQGRDQSAAVNAAASVDRAATQQALSKVGTTPSFSLSDFKERKQGRDGKYYDA